MTQINAEKTRMSGVQLAASQASSFERFTQMKKRGVECEFQGLSIAKSLNKKQKVLNVDGTTTV